MISNQDWKVYVDIGDVGIEVLEGIAQKIKTRETLDSRELAVYMGNSGIIESILRLK